MYQKASIPMSHEVNTELLELAQEHIDFWEGTVWARVINREIENAVKTGDLEVLHQLIRDSAKAMYQDYVSPEEGLDEWNF